MTVDIGDIDISMSDGAADPGRSAQRGKGTSAYAASFTVRTMWIGSCGRVRIPSGTFAKSADRKSRRFYLAETSRSSERPGFEKR